MFYVVWHGKCILWGKTDPTMTKKLNLTLLLIFAAAAISRGQAEYTLSEAIRTARTQSVEALEARQAFISTYWAYRSYQASKLPSVYLYGDLMNFDRSLTLLQNPDDGSLKYVSSNNLQNGVGLQINQNITFTGGTLSVFSDLSRIDQFGGNKSLTWYSRPVTVSYYQPTTSSNGTGRSSRRHMKRESVITLRRWNRLPSMWYMHITTSCLRK